MQLNGCKCIRNRSVAQVFFEIIDFYCRENTEKLRGEASAMKDFVVFEYAAIDPHYLDLYKIRILAGRNLSMQDSIGNILINKTLAKNLELGSPEEAVGNGSKKRGQELAKVAGVVDDFIQIH